MDKMGNKKNGRNFRKGIAFTLVMAMLVSTISFGTESLGSGGNSKAYAETADIQVTVRIEGYDNTFLSNTNVSIPAGSTAWEAVSKAAVNNDIQISTINGYIDSVSKGGVIWAGGNTNFAPADSGSWNMSGWVYRINEQSVGNVGINEKIISAGDTITLAYGAYGDYGFFENANYYGVENKPVSVKVKKDSFGIMGIVSGASIYDYNASEPSKPLRGMTGSDGVASVTFPVAGVYGLTAENYVPGYLTSGDINTITRPYTKVTVITAAEMKNKVISDAANLLISYNGTDSTIELPTSGASGASISWTSSDTSIIGNEGTIKRPVCGAGNALVTMSAIIGDAGYAENKNFALIVKEYTAAEVQASLDGMGSADIPKALITESKVWVGTFSQDNQIKFIWKSSRTDIIGEEQGTWGALNVKQPNIGEAEIPVTLTVEAISGSVTKYRSFDVKVAPLDNNAKASELNTFINTIALDVQKENKITDHMSYGSEWIQAMVSAGKGDMISSQDKSNYLAMALEEAQSDRTNIGKMGKIIVGLTALGIDPRKIPGKISGESINLVENLYTSGAGLSFGSQYEIPYVLMAYNLNFTPAGINRNQVIYETINHMAAIEGGSLSNTNYYNAWAADSIGMFSAVLSPYYSTNTTAQGIIDRGITWLNSNQISGTFGNANSDAMVVLGLSPLMEYPTLKAGNEDFLYMIGNGLLDYKTADSKGFAYFGTYNLLATVQGFQAITAYRNHLTTSAIGTYIFDYPTINLDENPNWPVEKFPVEITVNPPTNTVFNKGDYIDISALDYKVTATYLDGSAGIIPNSLCSVSYIDTSTTGAKEVRVTYLGKVKTFTVIVKDSSSTVIAKDVTITIKDTSISGAKAVINSNSSVLSVLEEICALEGIEVVSYKGYVSSMNGKEEFGAGPNSGWLYQVNENTPSSTAAGEYKLSGGENIVWYYTLDFTKDSSSSSWVNENTLAGGTANTVSVSTDVPAKLDSKGNAAAVVSAAELSASIKKAVDGLAGDNEGKQTEIKINVGLDEKAVSLDTTIPKTIFGNLITNKIGMLTITSALGEISLDLNTLKTIFGEATGDVSISITKAEKVDGRPAVDLSVMSNGKKITEFGGIVTVRIPYTLASGEKSLGIKVYYVTEEGKLIDVKSSSYDESNKMATFQTDHFSKFLIAYNQITFKDIQGHWAQAYIERLANRDIIKGMTETTFVPDGNITRAQFAKLLAGLEGVDGSKYTTSQFSDVSQNAWYSGAVAWASDNNITLGYANANSTKNFNPNQNITRQDMAVMMRRYLDNVAKKTLSSVDAKIAFVDEKIIADYSKDAVLQLQQAGIINGKTTKTGETEFDPTGKLTRAEAAKIVASQL